MKTRMTIKYTSYGKVEDTTLYKILSYFTKERKNTIFRLDTDNGKFSWEETDIFIPSLSISKLEFHDTKEKYSHEYYATFMCNISEQYALLKLLLEITSIGDPGHSFCIDFGEDEKVFWDGDGSDRIDEINFIKDWNKKSFCESYSKLPYKILTYDRAYNELGDKLIDLDRNSPLWDKNVRVSLAKEAAKKMSDMQYEKFLSIKDSKEKEEK